MVGSLLRRSVIGSLLLWAGTRCVAFASGPGDEVVVLLHGLGRTAHSMDCMAGALQRAGFRVVNVSYPSRTATVEVLAERVRAEIAPEIETAAKVHFVTHSMGGIVLRRMLKTKPISNLGRTVMLAPPNGGSEVVDRLRSRWSFRWSVGPAGLELGTDGIVRELGRFPGECAVIAGNRSINWINSTFLLRGPDDGKVTVSSAKLEGASFLLLHVTHTFIMRNARVIGATCGFLKTGSPPAAS